MHVHVFCHMERRSRLALKECERRVETLVSLGHAKTRQRTLSVNAVGMPFPRLTALSAQYVTANSMFSLCLSEGPVSYIQSRNGYHRSWDEFLSTLLELLMDCQ